MRILTIWLAVFVIANHAAASETSPRTVAGACPQMYSGALRDAELADLVDDIVAASEGISIAHKDIEDQINKAPAYLRDQMRRYPVYALEQYITTQLTMLEAEEWAKKTGRGSSSGDALMQSYLDAQLPKFTVTDKEAEEFYKERAKLFGGAPYDRVKDAVVGYMIDERKREAEDRFKAGVSKRHKVRVSASWFASEHEKWAANPVERARVSGKPSFVNFGVIGCCDKMYPIIQDVRAAYGRKINVVFVHVGQEEVLSNLYGVSEIPVQVFFDKDGKQLFRHTGFLAKDQIAAKLSEMGVK